MAVKRYQNKWSHSNQCLILPYLMANHNKFIISDIYRRPAYWFGHPNTGVKKTFFKFSFFQLYFNKKYVEVAITMHLISLKCLRKCRQKRNTMRQRDRSKRRNCRQRCFHSFNFINHASIRFFVSVNSLHFFLWLFLYYLLHLLSSDWLAGLTNL